MVIIPASRFPITTYIKRSCVQAVRYLSRSQDEPLRNAQASEVFRSAFLDGVRAQNRISSEDIDDMMASNRARPSLILPVYQIVGLSLGAVARFSPQECRQVIEKAVHSATVQQFNDSIRNIQVDGDETTAAIDSKETLKYHRDLETDTNQANSTTYNSSETNEGQTDSGISGTGLTASTALYHFLKISRTV